MNYKDIIDRVLDTTKQSIEDGKVIKTIKNDIYDTLRDMDNASEHPRKEYKATISETESAVENFEDTNNINSNLSIGSGITYDSNFALFGLAWFILKTQDKLKPQTKALLILTKKVKMFLAIFNMIPIRPFDGGHVFAGIISTISGTLGL